MIDLVKDLVEQYVKGESTIIVVTIPATGESDQHSRWLVD